MLVLVFALLAALAVARLTVLDSRAGAAFALLVVAGAAIYAHPIVTGAIGRTSGRCSPDAFAFPRSSRRPHGASTIRRNRGRPWSCPSSTTTRRRRPGVTYGASFAVSSSAGLSSKWCPVATTGTRPVADLVESIEDRVRGGGRGSSRSSGHSARYIVLRRDLDTRFPGRTFADPRTLSAGLRHSPDFRLLGSSDVMEVYEAGQDRVAGGIRSGADRRRRRGSAAALTRLLGPHVGNAMAVVPLRASRTRVRSDGRGERRRAASRSRRRRRAPRPPTRVRLLHRAGGRASGGSTLTSTLRAAVSSRRRRRRRERAVDAGTVADLRRIAGPSTTAAPHADRAPDDVARGSATATSSTTAA